MFTALCIPQRFIKWLRVGITRIIKSVLASKTHWGRQTSGVLRWRNSHETGTEEERVTGLLRLRKVNKGGDTGVEAA